MKKITIITIGALVFIGGLIIWSMQSSPVEYESWDDALSPVGSIYDEFGGNHLHGMGYDSDNNRLFLATHYGLFAMQDNQLYQLGDNRDDFMGFSLNPHDGNVIYTSGHPRMGGNLGVMKSEDGGLTFERIFSGLDQGRVDFHSMAISYSNPDILYGFFRGRLYRTLDGGESWEYANAMVSNRGNEAALQQGFCWHVPCLSTDTEEESVVYAGTEMGLAVSEDFGDTWKIIESDAGAVASVGVDPHNSERLFAHTDVYGVAVSEDGGESWTAIGEGLELSPDEYIFAFAFDKNNPNRVFAATVADQVFITEDGGETWEVLL